MWNKKVEGDYGVERESTGKGEGKPGRAMAGEKTYVRVSLIPRFYA